MPLLDQTGTIVEDPWTRVSDDQDLPSSGDVIVSFDRLPDRHNGRLGVSFPNDFDLGSLETLRPDSEIIVLTFPTFADGRAYSQARMLRNRLGYSGELRAAGDLLPDQVAFMQEVGFTSFEVQSDRFPVERWREALAAVSLTYHRSFARQGQQAVIAARHL